MKKIYNSPKVETGSLVGGPMMLPNSPLNGSYDPYNPNNIP